MLFENKTSKEKIRGTSICFELHFTLNHFLKTKGVENLHDLFDTDTEYVLSGPVCEQNWL